MIPSPILAISSKQPLITNREIYARIRRPVGTALLYLIVVEATIFASGQMLHVGSATVKMILFGLAIVYTVISVYCGERLTLSSVLLLSCLLSTISVAVFIGLLHGAASKIIWKDVSPQLYFLLIPFCELTIATSRDVARVIRIITMGSIFMSAAYLAFLGALLLGKVSVGNLYALLASLGGDFMYDGLSDRIFYKGFLYIGVAIILFAFQKGLWSKIAMWFLFLVILSTMTRGFLLALFAVAILYALIRPGGSIAKFATVWIVLIIGGVVVPIFFGSIGNRAHSDNVRITTINQVVNRIDWISPIIGHGFGIGVPERPEHMEIAYLEILQKQGVIGLLWLAAIAFVLVARFRRAVRYGDKPVAYALLLSASFVFFESLTNPYINNPIGISVIVICLAGLRVLAGSTDRIYLSAPHQEMTIG